MKNIAIILAAGKSRRMKGPDKVFFKIKGKPLFVYTLLIFEKHPLIDKIILVFRKNKQKRFISAIKKLNTKKISAIVGGGKEWQDSAFLGLEAAGKMGAKSGDLILFHNAANPLVSKEEINKVLDSARKYKAALLCQPAKDTVKEVGEENFVFRTLDRKKIFLAQVPQVIEYSLAQESFKKAREDKFYGTDAVSLVERLGKKVKIVSCSYRNTKITTRDDLKMVSSFLAG